MADLREEHHKLNDMENRYTHFVQLEKEIKELKHLFDELAHLVQEQVSVFLCSMIVKISSIHCIKGQSVTSIAQYMESIKDYTDRVIDILPLAIDERRSVKKVTEEYFVLIVIFNRYIFRKRLA